MQVASGCWWVCNVSGVRIGMKILHSKWPCYANCYGVVVGSPWLWCGNWYDKVRFHMALLYKLLWGGGVEINMNIVVFIWLCYASCCGMLVDVQVWELV